MSEPSAQSPGRETATSSFGRPAKKKRVHLNCRECRRTKTRCDRQWPCSSCVIKGLGDSCPNGVLKTEPSSKSVITRLEAKVRDLELRLNHAAAGTFPASGEFPTSAPARRLEAGANGGGAHQTSPFGGALESAAMLKGIVVSPEPSQNPTRPIGADATAFYMSSPDDSSDDGETHAGRYVQQTRHTRQRPPKSSRVEARGIPWEQSDGINLMGCGNLPGELLDRCRDILPTRHEARELFEAFWSATSWRFQPLSRAYFIDYVLPSIYEPTAGIHPHHIALLFSVIAMALSLSSLDDHLAVMFAPAITYHEISYACLIAANFYTDITLSSLITSHLVGAFLLNSSDIKSPNAIFSVIGLAVRLATIAGYHREASHLTEQSTVQADGRRRIWYELLAVERVHCMASVLPLTIRNADFDTEFPRDEPPDSFLGIKWRLGQLMSAAIEYWSATVTPPHKVLIEIDEAIRNLAARLPSNLRYTGQIHDESAPWLGQATNTPADQMPLSPLRTAQRGRLAEHFYMLVLYLHRPLFIHAIAGSTSPNAGEASHRKSLDVVSQTCNGMIKLVDDILSMGRITTRWFSFTADLLTILHCQTALAIHHSRSGDGSDGHFTLLQQGVGILARVAIQNPSPKHKAILRRARQLLSAAERAQSQPTGWTGTLAHVQTDALHAPAWWNTILSEPGLVQGTGQDTLDAAGLQSSTGPGQAGAFGPQARGGGIIGAPGTASAATFTPMSGTMGTGGMDDGFDEWFEALITNDGGHV